MHQGPHPYTPHQAELLTATKQLSWERALELGRLMDEVFDLAGVFDDFHRLGYRVLQDVDREHHKKIQRLTYLPQEKRAIYLRRLLKMFPETLDAELIILMAIITSVRVADTLEIRLRLSDPRHPDYKPISAAEANFHLQHEIAALEMHYTFPAHVLSAGGCEVDFTSSEARPGIVLGL